MQEFDLDFIKRRRIELKLSTVDMAEKLHFSNPSVYWKYEKGLYKFNADLLPMLANILQCRPENFFKHISSETEQ